MQSVCSLEICLKSSIIKSCVMKALTGNEDVCVD